MAKDRRLAKDGKRKQIVVKDRRLAKEKRMLASCSAPFFQKNTYSNGIFHVCYSRVELGEMEFRAEGNGKRQITGYQSGIDQCIFPVLVVGKDCGVMLTSCNTL